MARGNHREVHVAPGQSLEEALNAPPPVAPAADTLMGIFGLTRTARRIVGIDPGLDGGIALVGGEAPELRIMPTTKTGKGARRQIDRRELLACLRALAPDHVFLEQVGPHAQDGVLGAFTFGRCIEAIESALVFLEIPYTTVPPQTWQKDMFLGLARDDTKATAAMVAARLWPRGWPRSFMPSPRFKKPHDGLVDAALLAAWGAAKR